MIRKNRLSKSRKPKKYRKSRKNKNSFMRRTFKKMFKGGMIPPHILNRYTKNDSDSDTDSEGPAPQPKMTESELSLARSEYYNTPLSPIIPKGEKQSIIPHSGVVGYKNLPVEGKIEEVDKSDDEWVLPAKKPGQMSNVNPLPPGYNLKKDAQRALAWDKYLKKNKTMKKKTQEEARKNLDYYGTKQLDDSIEERIKNEEIQDRKRELEEHFTEQATLNLPLNLNKHFGEHKNTTVVVRENPDYSPVQKAPSKLKQLFAKVKKTLKRKNRKPNRTPSPPPMEA
jgi:hypothetical protein